jgi:hypothetical protein
VPVSSTELTGPGTLLRIWPEIFDFEADLGLKLGQTRPKISATVPTNRHPRVPNDSGPISACFDDDPKPFNCEIAQPSNALACNTNFNFCLSPEMALELVSGADFGCNRRCKTNPVNLEGSRGQVLVVLGWFLGCFRKGWGTFLTVRWLSRGGLGPKTHPQRWDVGVPGSRLHPASGYNPNFVSI